MAYYFGLRQTSFAQGLKIMWFYVIKGGYQRLLLATVNGGSFKAVFSFYSSERMVPFNKKTCSSKTKNYFNVLNICQYYVFLPPKPEP